MFLRTSSSLQGLRAVIVRMRLSVLVTMVRIMFSILDSNLNVQFRVFNSGRNSFAAEPSSPGIFLRFAGAR